MNGFDACFATIRAAAQRDLSDEELDTLLSQLQLRQRLLQARGAASDARAAAVQAAEEIADELAIAAAIERRNAAMNLSTRLEKTAWIQQHFGNNIAEGLEALLVGVNRAKTGAREGAAQVQESLKNRYHAGLVADLEHDGHMALFASGAMDRDVARALWALGSNDTQALARLPAEAKGIAQVLAKWQEVSRLDANDAGAAVGKAAGYITRQTHDVERIRKAGFEAWKAEALQRFDLDRMAAESGATDRDRQLKALWTNLATGNHMKAVPVDEVSGFKGPSNLAKKVSQQRVIHFKSADDWFDYNQKFGTGNLRETVSASLLHSAESTGLMRTLGTNPGAMFDAIKNDLVVAAKDAGKVDMVSRLAEKEGRLANFMAAVDGSMSIPGNALWARRAANVRSWEMLSKLGGMVLSQLSDVAVYGAGTRYQGRGLFSGMSEAVGGLGRNLAKRETRELVHSLGIVLDDAAGALGRVGAFGEAGGMAKLTQLFMKLNLGNWWTSHMRASAALGMSSHLAEVSGREFDKLPADFQRVLGTYNIDAAAWDVIRQTAAKNVDGKRYIVPEAIRQLPDDVVRRFVGPAASDYAVGQARDELEARVRNYLTDQTSFLALEPDKKTRAVLLQGTRPGTVPGELMRFVMQFKSFTGAYMQKVLGRELFGRGYEGDSIVGALRNGNGEALGLAQLIATSTIMGYGSMALKDLAKGRTPRDPSESPGAAAQVMLAAMVQGGGAGIYGDFLFGQASRMGSGTIESLAGPVASSAGRIVDLYHKALAGDDVASNAFGELINNTPFVSLFYTRIALNYLIFYRLQESMNPGYLRRMERNVEQTQNQSFLLRPSDVVH